MPLMNRA